MDIFTAVSLNNKIISDNKNFDFQKLSTQKLLEFRDNIRNKYKAIVVGANTIKQDNPTLLNKSKINKRIIIDKYQDLSMDLKIFNIEPQKTYIIVLQKNDEYKKQIEKRGANYIVCKNEKEILDSISLIGGESILLEGGAKTIEMFIKLGMINKISIIQFPVLYSNKTLGMFEYIENNYNLTLRKSDVIDKQFIYLEYKITII